MRLKLFTFLAIAALLLAGCGGAAPAQPAAPAAQPAAQPAAPAAAPAAQPAAPAAAPAAEFRKTVDIGTGPSGGAFHATGLHMAQLITKHSPIQANGIPTGASLDNVKRMIKDQVQFGISYTSNLFWTRRGLENFPQAEVELVFTGHSAPWVLYVREDSGIQNYCDLKGKRLAGPPPGGVAGWRFLDAVLETCNLTQKDLATVVPTSNLNDSVDQIKSGQLDGLTWPVPRGGVGAMIDLVNSVPIRWVPMTEEQAKHVNSKMPYMQIMKLPKDWQIGSPEGYLTTGEHLQLFSIASVDEETVYLATKALLEGRESFKDLFKAGVEYTPENAISDREVVPYHRGAIRAYKEFGVWK